MSDNEKTANEIIEELEAENERLREGIDELARKITANAVEVARENQRLRKLNAELLAALIYRCAECNGWGTFRCQWYNKDGDMCRMAQSGTCDAWMTICKATGHDPAMPWEVTK